MGVSRIGYSGYVMLQMTKWGVGIGRVWLTDGFIHALSYTTEAAKSCFLLSLPEHVKSHLKITGRAPCLRCGMKMIWTYLFLEA